MDFDETWNYMVFLDNLKTLKEQYQWTLASFSWKELRERNEFMSKTKRNIYGMKMAMWKKDHIWNYLNDGEYDGLFRWAK